MHKTKMNLLKQDHLLHSSSCSPSPNLLRRQTHNSCVENSSGKLTIMNTGLGGCNTVLLGEYFKDHAPFVQGLESGEKLTTLFFLDSCLF